MSDQTDLQTWVKVRIDNMDERLTEVLDHAERVLSNAGSFKDLDLELIDSWQKANDARYEELRVTHNALCDLCEKNRVVLDERDAATLRRDEELLRRITSLDDRDRYTTHTFNQNARQARIHELLIVGSIALAAFALGRQS